MFVTFCKGSSATDFVTDVTDVTDRRKFGSGFCNGFNGCRSNPLFSGIIHLSLNLPLRSLRSLRLNHSDATGIDITDRKKRGEGRVGEMATNAQCFRPHALCPIPYSLFPIPYSLFPFHH
ncbi:MAG: hypothetical protein WBL95_07645 [Microcoleus sp.]